MGVPAGGVVVSGVVVASGAVASGAAWGSNVVAGGVSWIVGSTGVVARGRSIGAGGAISATDSGATIRRAARRASTEGLMLR